MFPAAIEFAHMFAGATPRNKATLDATAQAAQKRVDAGFGIFEEVFRSGYIQGLLLKMSQAEAEQAYADYVVGLIRKDVG